MTKKRPQPLSRTEAGRLGGLARAKALSAKERRKIATQGGTARVAQAERNASGQFAPHHAIPANRGLTASNACRMLTAMLKLAYKSRRYRQYIEWIAFNDSDADGPDVDRIADYLSTTMVAHVNNVAIRRVAEDVAAMRRQVAETADRSAAEFNAIATGTR